jgi:hypothetical protein
LLLTVLIVVGTLVYFRADYSTALLRTPRLIRVLALLQPLEQLATCLASQCNILISGDCLGSSQRCESTLLSGNIVDECISIVNSGNLKTMKIGIRVQKETLKLLTTIDDYLELNVATIECGDRTNCIA